MNLPGAFQALVDFRRNQHYHHHHHFLQLLTCQYPLEPISFCNSVALALEMLVSLSEHE
jgi:hypothetical protein